MDFKSVPKGLLNCQLCIVHCQLPGGDERDRTADPLLAKQVLSQLSYTPARFQLTIYN